MLKFTLLLSYNIQMVLKNVEYGVDLLHQLTQISLRLTPTNIIITLDKYETKNKRLDVQLYEQSYRN